jgi:hypothetical protein
MVAPFEVASRNVENPLPIVEVSGGVRHSKDGKGIGDLVDVETIDAWVGEYLSNRKITSNEDREVLAAAFQFGVRNEGPHAGQSFIEAEPEIRADWSSERGHVSWESVRDAIWAGFDRARDRTL